MAFPFDTSLDAPFGSADADEAEARRDVLGRDLFFDGNLHVAAKGDYQVIEGEENYRRAILRRLITSPGTYRLRPEYGAGVADSIKKKLTKSHIDELTVRIREQVAADRRTEKVISVTVTPLSVAGQFGPLAGVQGLRIHIVVQAFGRVLRPLAFRFAREG